MTRIQQVLWKLQMDYIGHPYYVSGNAILHALGQHLPHDVHRHLHASHGVFVPGQYGVFPDHHSHSGPRPHLGSGLPEVNRYDDLFLHRHPLHSWLVDARPKDALNTHDIRLQAGHPALAHETVMGQPESDRIRYRTTHWYIHAYLHADELDTLPLREDILDGLQFGGKRNYGYGTTKLKETRMIDLETLDYTRLQDNEPFSIKFVTPYVLESEYPNANDVSVPWWWGEDRNGLRLRKEKIVEQRTDYNLVTVDHGQLVTYTGDRPIETAKNGITRAGSHSRYGFGELRLMPQKTTGGRTE